MLDFLEKAFYEPAVSVESCNLMTFQLKIIAEQLHIIITFIIVCHNTAQDVFVDFALLSLHGDNLILEHILVLIRQIPLLNSQEIDAFGVPDDKFDAAAVPTDFL